MYIEELVVNNGLTLAQDKTFVISPCKEVASLVARTANQLGATIASRVRKLGQDYELGKKAFASKGSFGKRKVSKNRGKGARSKWLQALTAWRRR